MAREWEPGLGKKITFGAIFKCASPMRVRDPPYAWILADEMTEMKMIAFMIWASGCRPALRYAITNGDPFTPDPPNRFASWGSTVMVIINDPTM